MSSAVDQKTYLQKYLSGPSGDKKRKRKKNLKGKGFKIIDDDLDLSKLRPLDGDELDILDQGEDAPQIAGIIDERPEELKFKSSSKWRVINQDDGFNSKLKVEEVTRSIKEVEKENEIVFGKMYSDSEDEKKDSDTSVPQKNDITNKLKSKKKSQHHSDSDVSPPRRDKSNAKSKKNDSDESPPRRNSKKTNEIDSDASPPRRNHTADNLNSKHHKYDSERSATRKISRDNASNSKMSKIYQNDSDESPVRRKSVVNSNNLQKHNSHTSKIESNNRQRIRKPSRWGDFKEDNGSKQRSESPRTSDRTDKRRCSPTRSNQYKNFNNSKQINYDSDISPPRKSRHDSPKRDRSDPNMSPSRKRRSPDKLNERKSYKYKDISPKRNKHKKYSEQSSYNKRRYDSDSDASPPRQERRRNYDKINNTEQRKRQDSDSDLSPPRKDSKRRYQEQRSHRNSDEPPPSNKKMEKTLEGKKAGLQDAEQLKQENAAFRRKEDEVFKNMTDEMSGRNAQIVSRKSKRETSEDKQKQKDKAERQKALDEKYKKWSKGLKQIESQQAAVEDFIHEASKPLARYKDDKDLESKLKDVERQGDPMLQYMREKKREKGELGPEKPTYKGNFAPNRFNIRPGYRWDGVDRSNGYEKKFFEQRSKRKAQEEELYKWNTEDL